MWKLLRSRGRVCLSWSRSSPSPWVGRGGVRRLLGLSPSPSPGSGGAEFAVFRDLARVRALGRAERSSPSSGNQPESEPWVGRSGVRRLPGLSPSPSPGSGGVRRLPGLSPSSSPGSGGAELPMVPLAGPDCLSVSPCQVAPQLEWRRRRCPSVRPVSGAAK
jgi:hypothetical protein